jgi:hypothetical protein
MSESTAGSSESSSEKPAPGGGTPLSAADWDPAKVGSTLAACKSWMHWAEGLLEVVEDMSEELNKRRAHEGVFKALDQKKHEVSASAEIEQLTKQLARVTALLQKATNTQSGPDARTVLLRIDALIECVERCESRWHLVESAWEIGHREREGRPVTEFDSEMPRDQAWGELVASVETLVQAIRRASAKA